MRPHIRAFVEIVAQTMDLAGPVYEFGSYLVPGQEELADLRPLFAGRRYIGCDMRDGPGVDRVEDLAGLNLPDEAARTILCLETLEHTLDVATAVREMYRVLAPGGAMLVSVPFDFPIHGFPDDYWRITPSCMSQLLMPLEAALVGSQGVEKTPHTVFAVGFKAPLDVDLVDRARRCVTLFSEWQEQQRRALSVGLRLKRSLIGWARSKGERREWREFYNTNFSLRLPKERPEVIPATEPDHEFVASLLRKAR